MLYDMKWDDVKKEVESEAKRVLLRAASLMERHGWLQQELGSCRRGFCILGALEEAVYELDTRGYSSALFILEEHIGITDTGTEIAQWNDAVGRTKEEVVEAMRGAANAVR